MAVATSTVTYRDLEPQGFPGYRVGDDGSVWSRRKRGWADRPFPKWHRLKPVVTALGRARVSLCRGEGGDRMVKASVHRLVLLAFVGPCPEGMECCHADGDPLNNRLGNLRWDTKKANGEDAVRHGRTRRGTKNVNAKLTAKKVRAIRHRYAAVKSPGKKLGNGILSGIAREFGVTKETILYVVQRRVWAWVE